MSVDNLDPENSLILFGLHDNLREFIKLYENNNLPRVTMLSGKKGIGKCTLINHFLYYVFDNKNYDIKNFKLNKDTTFFQQKIANIFSNIIYLKGSIFNNIKIEDIRNLKERLSKTSILDKERYIILDNIELFNINSVNALLKIIEEPFSKDFFFLINNKTKPLIPTLCSRSFDFKISLNNENRIKIINSLIKLHKIEPMIDYNTLDITPGDFLLYNDICKNLGISIEDNFFENLENILTKFKKTKNIQLINFLFFITDYYFYNLQKENHQKIQQIMENKSFVKNNINNFINLNLNQNTLMNVINNRLLND